MLLVGSWKFPFHFLICYLDEFFQVNRVNCNRGSIGFQSKVACVWFKIKKVKIGFLILTKINFSFMNELFSLRFGTFLFMDNLIL